MDAGLKVFSPNGTLMFGPDTRPFKILGTLRLTSNAPSVSATNALLTLGTPVYQVKTNYYGSLFYGITVSFSGSTVTASRIVTYPDVVNDYGSIAPDTIVLYGIR